MTTQVNRFLTAVPVTEKRTLRKEKNWERGGLISRTLATHPKGFSSPNLALLTLLPRLCQIGTVSRFKVRPAVTSRTCSFPLKSVTRTDTLPPRARCS